MTTATVEDRRHAMGRFSVEVNLANRDDVFDYGKGRLSAAAVRRVKLSGVVDTGATRLVLPESVVIALGLTEHGETTAKYADGRTATKKIVGDVELEFCGRRGVFSAVVEPNRTDALIGAIVMEELDLIADCTTQKLHPRDPNTTITELE